MKLEEQYSSADLSLRLRELGVIQTVSHKQWVSVTNKNDPAKTTFIKLQDVGVGAIMAKSILEDKITNAESDYWAAFTVAELGVMLPKQRHGEGVFLSARTFSGAGEWQSMFHSFFPGEKNEHEHSYWDITEANSRAGLLIHLLEIGKISIDHVNHRLQQ